MTFEESITGHMTAIDVMLSHEGMPLKGRPLSAAIFFVKECILEISGDTKDDYAAKPWFAIIYHHIEQWYRDHYGAAFNAETDSTAIGVVLIRDIPIQLQVPLTTSRLEVPGETVWLKFPVEVDADEEPLSWLVAPPTLDRLNDGERAKVIASVADVARGLRSIKLNLMVVEPKDDPVNDLLASVLPELETAAHNIQRNDPKCWGTALWSLQMAVERTLKAFSQQKSGTFRELHNLLELYDDVALHGVAVKRDLLKKLPREKEVMNYRYGLGDLPRLGEVIEAYKAALSVVSGFSRAFERTLNIGGARFLIKKAPWIELPPSTSSDSAPE